MEAGIAERPPQVQSDIYPAVRGETAKTKIGSKSDRPTSDFIFAKP